VDSAPDKSKRRFVIYVKSWNYEEKVEVAKKNKNVMIAGEGMDFTIITKVVKIMILTRHGKPFTNSDYKNGS
jgi:pectinesterase